MAQPFQLLEQILLIPPMIIIPTMIAMITPIQKPAPVLSRPISSFNTTVAWFD